MLHDVVVVAGVVVTTAPDASSVVSHQLTAAVAASKRLRSHQVFERLCSDKRGGSQGCAENVLCFPRLNLFFRHRDWLLRACCPAAFPESKKLRLKRKETRGFANLQPSQLPSKQVRRAVSTKLMHLHSHVQACSLKKAIVSRGWASSSELASTILSVPKPHRKPQLHALTRLFSMHSDIVTVALEALQPGQQARN